MSDFTTVFRVGDRVIRQGSGQWATVRSFRETPPNSTNRIQVTWDDGYEDQTWHYSVVFDLVPDPKNQEP